MNNIIEKLGIAPAPWQTLDIEGQKGVTEKDNTSVLSVVWEEDTPFAVVYEDTDAQLIASGPEMLEALITSTIRLEEIALSGERPERNIEIIEKATGKSWEEIKELLV